MNTSQKTDSPNGAHPPTPNSSVALLAKDGNHPSTATLAEEGLAGLASILNPSTPLPVVPVASATETPALIETKPLPAPTPSRKIRRNGRVACLPKLQRDMVNRMIWNGVPYKNIVAALDEEGFTVTERNISNWANGGYLEWSLAQEHLLEHRLDQDHLLDSLRRDDAPELPEVGLQAAATHLSQIMLQKALQGDTAGLDLDRLSKLVDLLCRLNRELVPLQKQRDDSRRSLGREYDPASVKETEQLSALENERYFSNPPPDSNLSRPSEPPALPPIPTASFLARQAAEERHDAKIERMKRTAEMLKATIANRAPRSSQPQPVPNSNPPQPARHPKTPSSNPPPSQGPQPSTNPSIQLSTPPVPAPEAVR